MEEERERERKIEGRRRMSYESIDLLFVDEEPKKEKKLENDGQKKADKLFFLFSPSLLFGAFFLFLPSGDAIVSERG